MGGSGSTTSSCKSREEFSYVVDKSQLSIWLQPPMSEKSRRKANWIQESDRIM